MHQVTIHEAKTNLSKLIQESLTGEEVIIARGNRPLVKLVPLEEATKRTIGGAPGLVIEMADDFNEALDDFSEYAG